MVSTRTVIGTCVVSSRTVIHLRGVNENGDRHLSGVNENGLPAQCATCRTDTHILSFKNNFLCELFEIPISCYS